MVSGFDAPSIFPSSDSMTWHPLPSVGSHRSGSPTSQVLWGTPNPCRPSRRASYTFAWRYRSCARHFAGSRTRVGNDRASRVPRRPAVGMPCSNDPDGTNAPGRHCASMLPSAATTASAPILKLSRLNYTAYPLAVYASWLGLPRWTPRKTRFRLPTRLYRVGLGTHWVSLQGFETSSHLSSLSGLDPAHCGSFMTTA